MFPETIYFPSDSTTAILKEVTGKKEKVGRYEYTNGFVFKGTTVTFSEGFAEDVEETLKAIKYNHKTP